MSGSDIVFIAATVFALIGSGAVYAFAKNIERRHRASSSSSSAASVEEVRRTPFRVPGGPLVAQSVYASMTAIMRAAKKKGTAVDLRLKADSPVARGIELPEREVA